MNFSLFQKKTAPSEISVLPSTQSSNKVKKSGQSKVRGDAEKLQRRFFFSIFFFKLVAVEGAATTRSTIDKVQQDESKNSLSASEVGEIKAARLRTNEDPHPRKKLQYLLNFSFLPTKAAARLRRGNGAPCTVRLAPLISPWRRPPTRCTAGAGRSRTNSGTARLTLRIHPEFEN